MLGAMSQPVALISDEGFQSDISARDMAEGQNLRVWMALRGVLREARQALRPRHS